MGVFARIAIIDEVHHALIECTLIVSGETVMA